jgi:mannose-6-phosphate isomerase
MKLLPHLAQAVWGGDVLSRTYHINAKGAENVAEAWVLSTHKKGPAVVENGPYQGLTVPQILPLFDTARRNLPLVKLLDAKSTLSIQVHPPNDAPCLDKGESGKTECWLILAAQPGARLLLGFKKEYAPSEVRAAILGGYLEDLTQEVPVQPDDVFFIAPGTLHAIGAGIVLAEVQQCSDTTYRVYDFGRLDHGIPRPLHIEKAMQVLHLEPAHNAKTALPIRCPFFSVSALTVEKSTAQTHHTTDFSHLLVLDGAVRCGDVSLRKGESALLPPASSFPLTGQGELLFSQPTA